MADTIWLCNAISHCPDDHYDCKGSEKLHELSVQSGSLNSQSSWAKKKRLLRECRPRPLHQFDGTSFSNARVSCAADSLIQEELKPYILVCDEEVVLLLRAGGDQINLPAHHFVPQGACDAVAAVGFSDHEVIFRIGLPPCDGWQRSSGRPWLEWSTALSVPFSIGPKLVVGQRVWSRLQSDGRQAVQVGKPVEGTPESLVAAHASEGVQLALDHASMVRAATEMDSTQ